MSNAHRLAHWRQWKLRGFGMEVSSFDDMPGEARAHLLRVQFAIHIRKHVDAPLALGIHRNPGERRFFPGNHFDSGKVQSVFGKSARNQPSALVVSDESKPPGFGPQARDLREIVSGNAAGVNFQALSVDFLVRPKQARNNSKIIDAATSDSDDGCHGAEYKSLRVEESKRARESALAL